MKFFSSKINSSAVDLALLVLRVVAGSAMLTHGIPKLIKLFTVRPIVFANPVGLGVVPSMMLSTFAEFACAILIILGLFTRLAAIPLVINFTVIFFVVHQALPFAGKELPLLFLVIFFSILLSGGGRYSLDRRLFRS